MADARGGRTGIDYTDQVYGGWGVAKIYRKVDDSLTLDTGYVFCALDAVGTCGVSPETAVGFKSTTTMPDATTRVVRFDAAGRKLEAVDGRTNASLSTPKSDAELTTENYKLASLVERTATPEGKTAQYDYTPDDRGLVARVTDAMAKTTQQEWTRDDARNLHQVASRLSPMNLLRQFAYTASGRLNKIVQPDNNFTEITYNQTNQPGLPETQKDPRGNLTQFAYSPVGNLKKITNAKGEFTEREFDALGRVITSTDAKGGITRTEYDAAGNVTKVTDPLLRITLSSYDEVGNLKTRTDAAGTVTTYGYDKLNRLIRTSVALSPNQTIVTSYEYDTLGRVTKVINPNSNPTTTGYDEAGNPIAKAVGSLPATQYEYDKDNRVTQVTDPEGRVTKTTYDLMGRVTDVETAAGRQQHYDYDGDGRVTVFTDALGRQTLYTYKDRDESGNPSHGRLWKVQDPLLNITRAEYDAAGNVTEIWGPGKDTAGNYVRTQFNEYDALNRRIRSTDANDRVWQTEYDANGNVSRRIAPGNLITSYTYDAANQLKTVQLPDGQTIAYDYDANGNRQTMTDATGTTAYAYDRLNRLTQVTDPKGKLVKYGYDAASNRTRITYPNNKQVVYGFDTAERLTTVTDWLGATTSYTLNNASQVKDINFGNGTSSHIDYDSSGRLDLLNHSAAGTTFASQDPNRELNGLIKDITATLPLLPSFESSTTDMVYDKANRLLTVNGTAVTHDDAGRITGLNGASYSYDARDLLTRYQPATGAASTYTYNGAGHRVSKTEGSTTTRYVIDPNAELPNVIAETNNAGTIRRSYIYGYGLLSQIDEATSQPRYYHHDITGHTLALTDATGTVTDKYAYTPYGDTTSQGTTPNPFKYVGKYGVMDEGNGLHFMRARYYRADVSRFLGLDQVEGGIGRNRSSNRYTYVSSSPIILIDPAGLEATTVTSVGKDAIKDKLIEVSKEAAIEASLDDIKQAMVSRGLTSEERFDKGADLFKSLLKNDFDGKTGVDLLVQMAEGKNLSPTGGHWECSIDQFMAKPFYNSKEECLLIYTSAQTEGPSKLEKATADAYNACVNRRDKYGAECGTYMTLEYIKGVGTTLKWTSGAIEWLYKSTLGVESAN